MKDWCNAILLFIEVVEGAIESEGFRDALYSETKEVVRRLWQKRKKD